MSKAHTIENLSKILDSDLSWRRKELSDIKTGYKRADSHAKKAFQRCIFIMSYAHWEGFIRECANRYFEYITFRRLTFSDLNRQFYINRFLVRIDKLHQARQSRQAICDLLDEILDGVGDRFTRINQELIDTKSNLNTDVILELCLICGVDGSYFESERSFLDVILLKRRNAIAHGDTLDLDDYLIDDFVNRVLQLMIHFRTLVENQIVMNSFKAHS